MTDNRKLAPSEQVMEILNQYANSFNVLTISRIRGELSEGILRSALDSVQSYHPRLKSCIVGLLDNLCFENGGINIPLRVVDNLYSEQWQDVVLEELNQKIDSSKGLLRTVLVLPKNETSISYFITTVHHAISDGISCVQLNSTILTYCQKIVSGEPVDEICSLPTLPPVEELLPKPIKGFRGSMNDILFLLRLKLEQMWYKPENLGFQECVPLKLRRCGMVHRKLDKELTTQLIKISKKEKTTVHGALCAAMMFAAARKISDEKKTKVSVSCWSPVNLRKHLKPIISDEVMSSLASHITSFHTVKTNTSFWDLAQDVKQWLETDLKRDDIFRQVLMYKKAFEYFLAHPNKVPATLAVSNIGQVNIPKNYGLFELEEISFVSAQAAFGGCFSVAVTTFQGNMFLNFIFSEPSISRSTMEEITNDAISCLVNACCRERFFWGDK